MFACFFLNVMHWAIFFLLLWFIAFDIFVCLCSSINFVVQYGFWGPARFTFCCISSVK